MWSKFDFYYTNTTLLKQKWVVFHLFLSTPAFPEPIFLRISYLWKEYKRHLENFALDQIPPKVKGLVVEIGKKRNTNVKKDLSIYIHINWFFFYIRIRFASFFPISTTNPFTLFGGIWAKVKISKYLLYSFQRYEILRKMGSGNAGVLKKRWNTTHFCSVT